MIHSNLSEGEIVKFKYFNTEQNKFYPCRETITFSKDMIVADAYNSYKLNVNTAARPFRRGPRRCAARGYRPAVISNYRWK